MGKSRWRRKGTPNVEMPEWAKEPIYMEAAYNQGCRQPMEEIIERALLRIMFSAVRWEGLTPIESQFIERSLITTGRVLAVKGRPEYSFTNDSVFFGRFSNNEALYDFYGQPYKATAIGLNGLEIEANYDSYVIGYDTTAVSVIAPIVPPRFYLAREMAHRIYDAYAAWQVARETSKSAMIITTPNDQLAKTVKEILTSVTENAPYVVLTNGPQAMGDQIEIQYRNHTELVKVHYDNYINTWGMALDIMGFANAAPNKHERMIVGEMELDQSIANYVSGDWMSAREAFGEQVSKKLGKTIRPINRSKEVREEAMSNVQQMGNSGGDAISPVDKETGRK